MMRELRTLPLTSSALAAASTAAIRFGSTLASCFNMRARIAGSSTSAACTVKCTPAAASISRRARLPDASTISCSLAVADILNLFVPRIAIVHELQDRRRRFLHRAARDIDDRPLVLRADLARVGDLGSDAIAVDIIAEV